MEVGKDWEEGVRAASGGAQDGLGKGVFGVPYGGGGAVREKELGKVWGFVWVKKLTGWSIDKANICLYY
jgi:hypothetical protein